MSRPAVIWIGIVVGLLGSNLAVQGFLLFHALNDPSFAVEADYEQKAANYNAIQRQRAASQRLGWEVALETAPAEQPGHVDVTLTVTDRAGNLLEGATVQFEAFHNARAAKKHQGQIPESTAAGVYESRLPFTRSGIWEFRMQIRHGEALWTGKLRKSVLSTPRSPGARG